MKSFALVSILLVSVALAGSAPVSARDHRSRTNRAVPTPAATVHDYQALLVSIPHRLTKSEARRRVKKALADLQRDQGSLLTIERQIWRGYRVRLRARVLGQTVLGTIDVRKDHVNLRILLPPGLALVGVIARPILLERGSAILAYS